MNKKDECLNLVKEGLEILELWNHLPCEIETSRDDYFRTLVGEYGAYKSVRGDILFEVQGTMSLVERLRKMKKLLDERRRTF